jgi:hypothetical protein
MIIAAAIVLATQTETWSPLYPVSKGDIDAKWRYSYGQSPFKTSRPLFKEVTKKVNDAYNRKADLEKLAKDSMAGFMRRPNMKQLSTATLIRYYHYLETRRLDLVDSIWYENAWRIVFNHTNAGSIPKVDCDPADYYLSRIRFLADSCDSRALPVRKIGYQLYLRDRTDWRVARRLANVLVLSSAFERRIALEIVSDLETTYPKDWKTWSLSAFVPHWSGYYTKNPKQLVIAMNSINRTISDPAVPNSEMPSLQREKKWIQEDLDRFGAKVSRTGERK